MLWAGLVVMMTHSWTYYIGPMGIRYRVDDMNKLVEIDAGKRGWIKSEVPWTRFDRDRAKFREFCRPARSSRDDV